MGVETHERVSDLAAEWDELAERVDASPFARPGWFRAWTDAFRSPGFVVVALRRDGELRALAPLVARFGAFTSATNWHSPLYSFVAEDAAAERELADWLVRRVRRRLTLSLLTDESVAACSAAAAAVGAAASTRTVLRSPYVAVNGSFADYLAGRERKWIKEVERLRRRISEQGELSLDLSSDLGKLEEGLRVESSGWKAERGTAVAAREDTRRFYEGVASWAASRGWLTLAFLRLDGAPLAFELLLEDDRCRWNLKGGYDPAFARFGPGNVLAYELLSDTHDRRLQSYEFLGADDPFKLRWTDTVRERTKLEVYRGIAGAVERRLWAVPQERLRTRLRRTRG